MRANGWPAERSLSRPLHVRKDHAFGLLENLSSFGLKFRFADIIFCSSLTDAAIAGIGACCPSLRQVNLSHLSLLTDIAIAHITDGLRALQALDLRRCNFRWDLMLICGWVVERIEC